MKVKKNVTIDVDVFKKLKEESIKVDRNVSNLVNKILKDYFQQKK